MRRLVIAGLALLLVPALALAGKTVTEGNQTLQIKAKFDPAKASKSKQKRRATEVDFDYVTDTTDGSRIPDTSDLVIYLGGAKFAFGALPACDETDAATDGDGVCPDGSLMGSGTGVAELHNPDDPSADADIDVDVKVYNGMLDTDENGDPMDPRPGILFYTEVGDIKVTVPFWGERRGKQIALRGPAEDPDPNADSAFEIKEVHLQIDRRSVRKGGKKTPFVGLPTKCDRKWVVTATSDAYGRDPLTAKHKVRCQDA